MNRRSFVKLMIGCGIAGVTRGRLAFAQAAGPGVMWVHVHADGGWDQALTCDPKPSLRRLSAADATIRRAGNISYLAFADLGGPPGAGFFGKYHDRLLVLNGVDTGTNNHETGTRYSVTGSSNEGYPCFAAQVAAVYGQALPMAFLDYGGYDPTADLLAPTRIRADGTGVLASLIAPNADPDGGLFLPAGSASLVEDAQKRRIARLQKGSKLPGQQLGLSKLLQVRQAQKDLARLQIPTGPDDLLKLAKIGFQAYQQGLAVSMGLSVSGFDSHSANEANQAAALQQLFGIVSAMVDESERRALAAVFVMTSDFGRSPHYTNDGTDHWPASTVMILQNAQAKTKNLGLPTDMVIGGTTDGSTAQALKAQKVNPKSLQLDSGGTVLTPGHVTSALRRVAQIASADALRRFPITVDQELQLG